MDWAHFRSQFPVVRRWAFLDHAAVAPIPTRAMLALEEYSRRIAENGIADIWYWVDRVAHVRRLAARLINAPAVEDIAFVPNTTLGIGWIAEGFPWQPGENVVLAAEEYPSNQYPWYNLRNRGVEVRLVPSRGNQITIEDVLSTIDSRTRVLSASFVQFGSGFRANLDRLGEICRERGIFFFVDAIQGLGVFPIDVQRTPIDALAADGHKWLLAPEGAGIAYIRREWLDRLHPIGVGAHSVVKPFDYSQIHFQLKPHAGRYEGGALNIPGITALGESLELLLSTGIDNIQRRVLELTDYLCDHAAGAGLKLFSSRVAEEKSGIVSLVHPTIPHKEIMKRCRDAGIIINVRAERLRVSPHAYNTEAELDQFLETVKGVSHAH